MVGPKQLILRRNFNIKKSIYTNSLHYFSLKSKKEYFYSFYKVIGLPSLSVNLPKMTLTTSIKNQNPNPPAVIKNKNAFPNFPA